MKAAVFYEPGSFLLEQRTLRALKKDELLIRVKACGVCGTDIHIYNGEEGSAPVKPPIVLGHEYSGEVVELGDEVTGFSKGDRVAVDPNMFCGKCSYCRSGKSHLCNKLTALGVNRDGGFEEYCIVPVSQAYKFPQHITYEEAAMIEPLACCLHGVDLAGINAGQSVAIIGGGAIGLLMLQLVRLRGASFIALSEPVEKRRNLALNLGADIVVNPREENIEQVIKSYCEDGVDVVIECVGKTAAMKQGLQVVKRGGTVLFFSVAKVGAALSIEPLEIFKKELTIKGSFINPATHDRALALISSGRVDVKPLITHRFNLEDIDKAIKMQTSPEAVKVLVIP